MPNNPKFTFPADGETITVIDGSRMFIAHGTVKLVGNAIPAGLNGHLVLPGSETVKATGSLLGWFRPGRKNETLYYWSVLFELDPDEVPDGEYDLIISTYLGSDAVKTAEEDNSSATLEAVSVETADSAGLTVSYPGNNTPINGGMFITNGAFTAGDRPTRAIMTENTTGVVYNAGAIFASGALAGYWYAAFPPLADGTYTLDVLAGTVSKTVTGLTV